MQAQCGPWTAADAAIPPASSGGHAAYDRHTHGDERQDKAASGSFREMLELDEDGEWPACPEGNEAKKKAEVWNAVASTRDLIP